MKLLRNLQISVSALALAASVGPCLSQTQMELNEQARDAAEKVEKQVDSAVKRLKSAPGAKADFNTRMADAQKKWKQFADAHVDSIFPLGPRQDYRMEYGSIYPLCWWNYRKALSSDRLAELRAWSKAVGKGEDRVTLKKALYDADKELNRVYQKVMMSDAKKIQHFAAKLTAAEKSWIAFRDADASAYASTHNSDDAGTKKLIELTRARTTQLQQWITGVEEGTGCAGSYPVRAD